MANISIKEISSKISELPTPDFIVQRIIKIASDPNSGTKELNSAVIESPSLTAKILKLSNSAYYALPRRVSKLSQAISILGFKSVRNLALSIFTANTFFKNEFDFFNTEKFWKHLISTGIASELLSKYVNYPEKEEAFLSGMLHDLGKIAMAFVMPDIFEMILKTSFHKKISFIEAESLLETYGHQQIGKLFFESWNLSPLITDVANFHDTPSALSNDNSRSIVNIVNVANSSINILQYGYSGCYNIPIPDSKSWNELGLTPKKYKNYFYNLKEKLNESDDFMNLKNIVEDIGNEMEEV